MKCGESLQAFKETFNIYKSKILPFNKEYKCKGVSKQTPSGINIQCLSF